MKLDWESMFIPTTSVLELIIRGTFMYLMLFVFLRPMVRRHSGTMSFMDLLLIVLIADAAQNGMVGESKSITEALIVCLTLIGWNFVLDWVAFKFPSIRPWLQPDPLPLILDGEIQRRNMQKEFISIDELLSHLRQQGIEELKSVKVAYIEPNGQISVIKSESSKDEQQPPKKQNIH